MKCPKLLSFIGLGTTHLPDGVCPGCLRSGGDHPHYLSVNPGYTCNQTNAHVLLCSTCDIHKASQKWFKDHFNPTLGFRNWRVWSKSFKCKGEAARGSSTTIPIAEEGVAQHTHDTGGSKKSSHIAKVRNKSILEERMLSIIVLLCIMGMISIITFANTIPGCVDIIQL